MNIRAGELTDLVTLRREETSSDGAGGRNSAWVDLAKVYGHMRPMTGTERQASDRTEAIAGYLLTIRARTDVTEKNKAVWRGREFNIRFVRDRKPRDLYLQLECDRGVAI